MGRRACAFLSFTLERIASCFKKVLISRSFPATGSIVCRHRGAGRVRQAEEQTLPSCRQLDQGESRGRTHRCCARSLRRTLAEACSRVVGLSEGMGSGGARRPAGAWLLDVGPKLHMALGSRKSARCIRASRRGATGDGWERGRSGLACLRTKWQEPAQVWWTAWLAFCRILMIACGPCTAEEC